VHSVLVPGQVREHSDSVEGLRKCSFTICTLVLVPGKAAGNSDVVLVLGRL